jgi:hypothetical protein
MVGTGSPAGGGADEEPADVEEVAPEAGRGATEVVIGVATMWRAVGVVLSTLFIVGAIVNGEMLLRSELEGTRGFRLASDVASPSP